MSDSDSTKAHRIAQAACAFERQTTGRTPKSVTVVLSEDTVLVTLHGTLSPAETALAGRPDGAARLQEFHRQLFTSASEPLRLMIGRIIGVEVREATAEVLASTGTVVQMFWLLRAVPTDTWSGTDPGSPATENELNGGTTPAA